MVSISRVWCKMQGRTWVIFFDAKLALAMCISTVLTEFLVQRKLIAISSRLLTLAALIDSSDCESN